MSVLSSVVDFCRERWIAYNRSIPLFHLGEIVQLGDLDGIGHPWASRYYARITRRDFVDGRWVYRVHLGHIDFSNLSIPEVFIGKV